MLMSEIEQNRLDRTKQEWSNKYNPLRDIEILQQGIERRDREIGQLKLEIAAMRAVLGKEADHVKRPDISPCSAG